MPMVVHRSGFVRRVSVAWMAAAAACSSGRSATDATLAHAEDSVAVPASRPIAFIGANVVSMRTSAIATAQTVIVRDRRIAAIGPEASTSVPQDAFVINSRGSWMMPGLADMHVHSVVRDAALYVPHGITTVRVLWGTPGGQDYARRVLEDDLHVPTIVSVSPGLDGRPPSWPFTRFVDDARMAVDTVRVVVGEGWLAIKIYDRLSREAFDSIVATAHGLGRRVAGHVPFAVSLQHALATGQDEIEHLSGYERALGGSWAAVDPSLIPALVTQTVVAGTWNCPTLAIISEIFRQRSPAERDVVVRNRRRFVKALHDAGAPLLVGTDSGIDIVPAGETIHAELAEFVAAGLTPYEALRAATYAPAMWLGIEREAGTVDVGRRADLLLLDANPLADVANVRRLRGVVLRGSWIPKRLLETPP